MKRNLRHPGATTRISDNWATHRARGSLGGTDFVDGYGTTVHAALDAAYVSIVDNSPDGSGGRVCRVTGPDGDSVERLHHHAVTAYRGQRVNAEDAVGISGASAFGSNYGTGGPHIHEHGISASGVRFNLEPYYWFLSGGSAPASGGNATPITVLTPEQIDEKEIDMTTGQILAGQRDWASWLNTGVNGRIDNQVLPLLRVIAERTLQAGEDLDEILESFKTPFYQIAPSGRGAAIDVIAGYAKTYPSWQAWQDDVKLGLTSGQIRLVTAQKFDELLAAAEKQRATKMAAAQADAVARGIDSSPA